MGGKGSGEWARTTAAREAAARRYNKNHPEKKNIADIAKEYNRLHPFIWEADILEALAKKVGGTGDAPAQHVSTCKPKTPTYYNNGGTTN